MPGREKIKQAPVRRTGCLPYINIGSLPQEEEFTSWDSPVPGLWLKGIPAICAFWDDVSRVRLPPCKGHVAKWYSNH